jgi:hypothetical protein
VISNSFSLLRLRESNGKNRVIKCHTEAHHEQSMRDEAQTRAGTFEKRFLSSKATF